MQRSKYTLLIDDFPARGRHLVFNTRTQAQVVVDNALKSALEELPRLPGNGRTQQALSSLCEMGIVVAGDTDEDLVLDRWFEKVKSSTSLIQATVLTTYDCNFACVYCVEEGVRSETAMDAATARQAASYIRQRAQKTRPERIFLSFYGGEPLLNPAAIRTVAGEVKSFAAEAGIAFSFGMTTNGALLTPRLVDELQGYGLEGVKITLDGSAPLHNRKRPFRNGRGSFDVIVKNILSAVERIEVDIGGNFDRENVASFPALLDYLKSVGLADKIHRVNFKPVTNTIHKRGSAAPGTDIGCVYFDPAIMEDLVALRRAALERNFRVERWMGINLCTQEMNPSFFIIDPVGRIYRCPAFVGRPEFSVGDIRRPGGEDFSTSDLWKRCRDCPYVPLCGDGCSYAAYVRYGDQDRLNCEKGFMEYVVKENLKLNYEFKAKKNWTQY